MKTVYVLTGEIRSGKTTSLMKWAGTQKNIGGIFQPVIEEKRFIYNIRFRTLKPLETDEKENVTSIGRYNFSNQTFAWSQDILIACLDKELEWIVIDEIGPLELSGKGLEPVFSKILNVRENFSAKILCVVREEILEKFIDHYNLRSDYEIFEIPL